MTQLFCRFVATLFTHSMKFIALGLLIINPLTLANAGFQVTGLELWDGNNQPFLIRGINLTHYQYPDKSLQALEDIANTGANSVRILISSGSQSTKTTVSELRDLINALKQHRLIGILALHDTSGFPDDINAITLSEATAYWMEVKDVLLEEHSYIMINIGSKPIGPNQLANLWINGHTEAIRTLREAGFQHAFMIDAPAQGEDLTKVMLNNAQVIASADPLNNTFFSLHAYDGYQTNADITRYVEQFRNTHQLPLVIGEFTSISPQAATIMTLSHSLNMGYLGWSWSGNAFNSTLESRSQLDIVTNFDSSKRTDWGRLLIESDYGINSTSEPASVFENSTLEDTPSNSQEPPESHNTKRTIGLFGPLNVMIFIAIGLLIKVRTS